MAEGLFLCLTANAKINKVTTYVHKRNATFVSIVIKTINVIGIQKRRVNATEARAVYVELKVAYPDLKHK